MILAHETSAVISPLLPLKEGHKTNLITGTLFEFPSPMYVACNFALFLFDRTL